MAKSLNFTAPPRAPAAAAGPAARGHLAEALLQRPRVTHRGRQAAVVEGVLQGRVGQHVVPAATTLQFGQLLEEPAVVLEEVLAAVEVPLDEGVVDEELAGPGRLHRAEVGGAAAADLAAYQTPKTFWFQKNDA